MSLHITSTLKNKCQLVQQERDKQKQKRKVLLEKESIENVLFWKNQHAFDNIFETTNSFFYDELAESIYYPTLTEELNLSYVYLVGSISYLKKIFLATTKKEIWGQFKASFCYY